MPSCEPVDLEELLVRTDGLSPQQVENIAHHYYEAYVSGVPMTHDGQRVWFFSNRFQHAFQRDNTRKGGNKNEIDLNRVQRVRWIGEVIAGNVAASVCRLVPDARDPRRGSSRLYMVDPECYVVWLTPRQNGGWTFSTAFKAFTYQMKKYRRLGEIIWRRRK
jgi:hypothetical protein